MDAEDSGKTREQLLEDLCELRASAGLVRARCALLLAATEVIPDAVYAKDALGRYTLVNTACARVLGMPVEEAIGKDDTELFAADDAWEMMQIDRQIVADGATITLEQTVSSAKPMRTIVSTKGPFRDDRGRIVGVLGISRDITEQRQADAALEQSWRRFQAIFENCPDGMLLIDDAGRFVDANPASCELVGYSREELLQLTISDVTPGLDRERIPELMGGFLFTGALSDEYTFLCKDGSWREVEYRSVSNILPGLHLGAHRDITKRKQVERDRQDREDLFHAVIEGITDAIYVKDLDGRNLMINSHGGRGLGRTVAEVIGRDAGVLYAPETAERVRAIDRRVMESEESTTLEELVTAAGVTRTLLTTKAPYRNANGEVIGVLGISRDISENKKAEEALRSSAERLRVLSRRVVEVQEQERRHVARELHDEIGQVLSAVGVNLQGLKVTASAAASARIEESIQIVDQAVEQVRNLSLELRPYMLDEIGLAASLRWLVDRQAQQPGLVAHFAVESSSSAPLPPSLATALFRVAQGALTNVVRHAHARNVWVELEQGEEQVGLLVRDDGAGFDLEGARLRAREGVAFGLLAIQERVALLGGGATVESQPGHGASVRVWFPLTATPAADESNEEGQP